MADSSPVSDFPYSPPTHTGLDIIHADIALLVLNKPAGLLSVPGRGPAKQDSLATRVQAEYPEARIVHRLDMETSGLMVLALDPDTHRALGQQFESRQVEKQYTAIVSGQLCPAAGSIDLPLITDWPNRPRQIVDHEHGKPSLTHYQALGYEASRDTTRVQLTPVTGRSHQLRVHMLSLGHPIVGDSLYFPDGSPASDRLMLHANRLAFAHPGSSQAMDFSSPPPF